MWLKFSTYGLTKISSGKHNFMAYIGFNLLVLAVIVLCPLIQSFGNICIRLSYQVSNVSN